MKHLCKIKISIVLVAIIFSSTNLFAQWSGGCPETTNCGVGIATNVPQGYFHVSPTYSGGIYPPSQPLILADYNWFGTQITTFTATNGGRVGIGTDNPFQTCHVVGTTLLQGNTEVQGNTQIEGSLTITSGGSNEFKVSNTGLLIARQIDVHLDPIPDYVFHAAYNNDSAAFYEKNGIYKAMSLEEVDKFIQQNRHLPGIKSAAQYQKTGTVNIGELQLQLLQKVEELMLYNIQLMNEIQELRDKQAKLEKQIITKP